jgi:hypothetical protein
MTPPQDVRKTWSTRPVRFQTRDGDQRQQFDRDPE